MTTSLGLGTAGTGRIESMAGRPLSVDSVEGLWLTESEVPRVDGEPVVY